MTLELKKKYVLMYGLQYIYKHKHIFNNTQWEFMSRHMSCHWSHYYACGSLRRILGCTKSTHGPVKCVSA